MVLHEGNDHVSLQIGLIVPLAQTATDFIDAFRRACYPHQTVKGAHSEAGDVTSASANLEKQTSHDSTQLLAFFMWCVKGSLSEQQRWRWRGTRE